MNDIVELSQVLIKIKNIIIIYHLFCINGAENQEIKDYASNLTNNFYNFKNINIEEIIDSLPIDSRINSLIVSNFKELFEISKKYDINCIDDIVQKILNLWDYNHINEEIFVKNVIVSFTKEYKIFNKYMTKSLGRIYLDMVNENIINPNQEVGVSSEPIYELLPVYQEYYKANLEIISNPLINWNKYSNGGHVLDKMCCHYTSSKENNLEFETKYYHDVIMTAIKSSCSVFDNKFDNHGIKEYEPVYIRLMGFSKCHSHLKDKEFIKKIKNYLLSDEGFSHQLDIYTYKNDISDKIIEEIKNERSRIKKKILQ